MIPTEINPVRGHKKELSTKKYRHNSEIKDAQNEKQTIQSKTDTDLLSIKKKIILIGFFIKFTGYSSPFSTKRTVKPYVMKNEIKI